MRWVKRIAIALAIIVGLLIAAAAGFMVWKPWVPPVEMTDPAPDGRRIRAGDVLGNYFPARGGGRHPAVLVLGGSEGALGAGTTRIARSLRDAGFSVLHLAYFRAPGQSAELALIPLERFDRALAWLKGQAEVDPARIALLGGSKGGEAVLLVGSRHPELRAVVAGMPSSVIWPGIDWNSMRGESRSSWSLDGRPVPALPYGEGSFISGKLSDIYSNGLKALSEHKNARIPIERGAFPILLVCGQADSLWPSCPMAAQLKATAPARVTVLAYPNAGHGVFGPPTTGDPKRLAVMGGSPAGNQAARQDGWPRVLTFLHGALD